MTTGRPADQRRPSRAVLPGGRGQIAAAAVVGSALRLAWLWRPLTPDEAGALVAARVWAGGGRLYTDLFIDRPQGFVLLFRLWNGVAPGWPQGVRLLAIAAGAVTVVAAASAARSISGRSAPAVAAAWIAAVVGASAAIEGYAANGELLAAAFGVPAMAIAAAVIGGRRRLPAMAVAGLLAGAAITVKQSGADVALAVVAWWVVAALKRWRPAGQVAAALAWFVAGLVVAPAASAVAGAASGWHRYLEAMVLFRLRVRSAAAGPQFGRLAATTLVAVPLLGPPTWCALRRLRAHPVPWRRRATPAHWLVVCWLGASTVAFAAGGNYHRHYWVQLAFPAAVAIGLVLGSAASPASTPPSVASIRPMLVRALTIPLLVSVVLALVPSLERDPRLDRDRAVAHWVARHRPEDVREVLPLCAEVTYHVDNGSVPRFPYQWVDHVRAAPGAIDQLAALLDEPGRPPLVALFQPVRACDHGGAIATALARHYRPIARVDGVPILVAAGRR